MAGVVSLDLDWRPYGLALAVVAVHHGPVGTLYPHEVFGPHGTGDPWLWAAEHTAFVLAASTAHLAAWRLDEDQVLSDPLTDLADRTLLEDVTRVLQRGGALSVLSIELDDFEDVNDSRGHAAGDVPLQAVAERLRNCVRPEDLVARLGGDEFAVVVHGGEEVARAVGQRVLLSFTRRSRPSARAPGPACRCARGRPSCCPRRRCARRWPWPSRS